MSVPATAPEADPTPLGAPRCAVASLQRADPLAGTALPSLRYLLVEDAGPWGVEPHPTGSLPVAAAAHVEAVARSIGARLLLVRRPGRAASRGERRWGVADIGAGTIAWGRARSAAALGDIDPGRDTTSSDDPVYLVCTHGRHDTCCAVEGRPVARELAAREPAATWECSHIGGDRFAANVLALPSGLVYGRVTPDDVGELLAAQRDGILVPRLLRGRSGVAPAGQVAEAHARAAWDEQRIDAVVVEHVEHVGHDAWKVSGRHTGDGRRFVAELSESHAPVASGLTCAASGPGLLRGWTVDRIDA
jgi:hypothetical protein